jgi:DNA-binding NarL/FixJ family response regulator
VVAETISRKRVLLADDNATVRSLVRRLFDLEPDFEVSGEAEDGRDAVEKAKALRPALVILDLTMPGLTGIDAALLIGKLLPDTRMILFTVHEGGEVERLATEAGIHAVISKNQGASKLVPQARELLASVEESDGALRNAS